MIPEMGRARSAAAESGSKTKAALGGSFDQENRTAAFEIQEPSPEKAGGFCLFGKIGRAVNSYRETSSYDAKAQAGIRLLNSGDPNSLLILKSMLKPNGERIRQTKLVRAGADPHEIDVREPAAHFEGYGVNVESFDLLHGLIAYLLGRWASFAVHGALTLRVTSWRPACRR
jgi:hypothetical protein